MSGEKLQGTDSPGAVGKAVAIVLMVLLLALIVIMIAALIVVIARAAF